MNLNGDWILRGKDESNQEINISATVPGCVHTDFINCGIIKDLYYRDNSKFYKWIEERDFTYEKTFFVEEAESNAYIEFDGLDTYCDIYLNDVLIGKGNNMFIPYAFCVDGTLKKGENCLRVEFRSPVREVEDRPKLGGAFTTERLHTRRIQCTYGWDWVDRFVTQGIYRDVRLVFRKQCEIENVYVYTKSITPYGAVVNGEFTFRDVVPEKDTVKIEIYTPAGECIFSKERTVLKESMYESFTIENPDVKYKDMKVSVVVDGKAIDGNVIPAFADGEHNVTVTIR